jgi:hypothetical protein
VTLIRRVVSRAVGDEWTESLNHSLSTQVLG